MIVCPNCGSSNPEGSRFCSNCGRALVADPPVGAQEPPVQSDPPPIVEDPPAADSTVPASPPVDRPPVERWTPPPPVPERPLAKRAPASSAPPSSLPATAPEWRMSDAGPLPEPRRRRTWLWIVGGVLGACLLIGCLVIVWASTIGSDTVNDFATRIAEEGTRNAGE